MIIEKSKEEEHSVTDESSSTSESAKVEEKFLTGVGQDIGLGSAKKTESVSAVDSGETDNKSVEPSADTVKDEQKILFVTPVSFENESTSQRQTTEQEVKSERYGEFGTTTIVAVEEETSSSSTPQSLLSLVDSSAKHLNIEASSTETSIVGKFVKTSDNEELNTTIQPDVLISSTLQTPLNVPTDSSEFLNISTEISESSVASSMVEESTIIAQISKTESGEREDQKETTVEFQEEAESTTIAAEITAIPITPSEITDDIVGFVASIVANISNNVPEADAKETTDLPEGSIAETHEIVSSVAPETAIVALHDEATVANIEETTHIETTSAESDAEVTPEKGSSDITVSDIPNTTTVEAASEVTSITAETSTSMSSKGNTEATSGILEKTSEDENNSGEDLFSKSVLNLITEQPFVQKDVDDIIKNIAQSKDILITVTKPAVANAAVEEEAIEKLEKGQGATEAVKDSSTIADTLVNGGQCILILRQEELNFIHAVFSSIIVQMTSFILLGLRVIPVYYSED